MREDEAWGGGEVKEGNKSCVWYFHIEKKKNILKTGLGFLPLEIVEKQNTAFKKRLEMFKNKNKTKQIGEKKKKKSSRVSLPSVLPFQKSTLGKAT